MESRNVSRHQKLGRLLLLLDARPLLPLLRRCGTTARPGRRRRRCAPGRIQTTRAWSSRLSRRVEDRGRATRHPIHGQRPSRAPLSSIWKASGSGGTIRTRRSRSRDGLLRDVLRLGQNTLSRDSRLVLDLERYDRITDLRRTTSRLIASWWISTARRVDQETLSWPKPEGSRRDQPRSSALPMPTFGLVQTVVVDPGHGGRDPGAIGRNGAAGEGRQPAPGQEASPPNASRSRGLPRS